ncbi:MAG TPA: carboxypeptidase-like regulatory domain-containing protein, partial [Blastocatellia bacterium]|nr:carboxypeptidase-like regulatory domain-containing protein [Blastocatellia bacterium]
MNTKMRHLMVKSIGLGLLVTVFAAFAIRGAAQSDNTQISGFVKDQAGGVIANAKVYVKNEARAFERNATTNSEGYFVITQLPPGLYTIRIEANGFKQYQETSRKLDPNLPASIDVSLQPGQVTETVTVTASVAQVQSESSTVGRLVETKQVEYLQLNGRNPLFLAQIRPGVQGG